MTMATTAGPGFPAWLPKNARLYLRHIEDGVPIRALARAEGVHASTVLRTVRAYENRRDDPLVDEALTLIGQARSDWKTTDGADVPCDPSHGSAQDMTVIHRSPAGVADGDLLQGEARRVLRRMAEQGTFLAIAPEMDKAVILKGGVRVAVIGRDIAQALALKNWISVLKPGRVMTYEITTAGRAAVRRWQEEDRAATGGRALAEAPQTFEPARPRATDDRVERDADGTQRRLRYNVGESPLGVLARRRDKDGKPFLTQNEVAAGERLREDFELAQMGPRVAQNWERFLAPVDGVGPQPGPGGVTGSGTARDRVALALRELGPGLGDMVLRCCCFLEGLEIAEQRLGWSARSGKIVLRIALMRLARHYLETYGRFGPKIG